MIYTVTVNPCLDVIRVVEAAGPHLVDGTYRPKSETSRPGGKGIDVSRALVSIGTETRALGFIGGQTGALVRGLLAAEGIDLDLIDTGVETRTNIILMVQEKDTDRVTAEVRINSLGKEVEANKYILLYDKAAEIRDATAVAISGSLCHNMHSTFYNYLITQFKRRNQGCVVMLDVSRSDATAEAMRLHQHRPDFVKPNLMEFNNLLNHLSLSALITADPPGDIGMEQYLEYAYTGAHLQHENRLPSEWRVDEHKLREKWGALLSRIVQAKREYDVSLLLSLGPMGCLAPVGTSGILHAYIADQLDAKTRVGAGDCLVAGFLSGYTSGYPGNFDLRRALCSAVGAAAARVVVNEHAGGGYLNRSEYERRWRDVRIDEYSSEAAFQNPQFLSQVPGSICRFGV